MTLWDILDDKKYRPERDRLTRIREGMKQRCHNPKNPGYASYGGKGVKVCDEWREPRFGLYHFIEWAISHGYSQTLTIDRIDPDGDYCPDNCRWITASENSSRANHAKRFHDAYEFIRENRESIAEISPSGENMRIKLLNGKVLLFSVNGFLEEALV